MKKLAVAATVLTLGLGAFALPAAAQDDYGQYRYTQNDPTRFAPDGLASSGSDEAGARDTDGNRSALGAFYEGIDRSHNAY